MPVTDPVLIFAIAMGIFLVVPLVFERLRVPGMIGLIIAGAVVGPNGLGVLARDATMELLGTVGLLYLMFLVGLELDLVDFNKYRNRSVLFGSLSFVIPQVLGTALGLGFGYRLTSSLLLGAVFASHTVLAYPIASRLGIVRNQAVTTTLGGTILTEILALLVLAVVVGSVTGGGIGLEFWATLLGSLALYVGLVLWGIPRIGRWFFRKMGKEGIGEFVFVMAVLFAVSYAAHAAHVEPIVGALLAGLALNRLVPHQGALMNRINFVGTALFIPFFLLSVGMLVDVRALSSAEAVWFSLALAVGVMLSKGAASLLMQRLSGYSSEEGWTIFGLSVPHASGTLAIVLVGFDIGLFDQAELNGVVLTILATSLVGPWLVERYGRRVALREEQKPYEPTEAPQRILIPMVNPATAEALLDLAFLVRGHSSEPLYPLMVVRSDAEDAEAQVAEAERMLGHAVIYAAGAEVPVLPLTRVDHKIAGGISRAIAETRSSMVIIGWEGRHRSVGHGIFGGVLDQLLEQTRQTVLVTKLGHPLNTTKRLVVVLPPVIHRHPGFWEGVRNIKRIAGTLGASVLGLTISTDGTRMAELFRKQKPDIPTAFEAVGDWKDLLPTLEAQVRPDDLIVVMSARYGTLPWHPKLERLPAQLAELAPESFIVMYPSEVEAARHVVTDIALPRGLVPSRVVADLPAMPFEEAIGQLLRAEFGADRPEHLRAITRTLVRAEEDFSTEVRPGVVVPHARVEGLEEPLLFLGISPEGIKFPQARRPAHLVFVLLSPLERPQEHLRSLSEIAHLVSNEDRLRELLQARTVEMLPDWFHAAGV